MFKQFPHTQYPLKAAFVLSVIYLLAIIPVSDVVPEWLAWENGPIENAQVVVLALGVIYNIFAAKGRATYGKVFFTAAAFLFLLGLRELSYGRVFFPTHMGSHGPEFIAMKDFPGHTAIYIFLGIYILLLLYAFVRHIPWRKLLTPPRPAAFLVIAAICALLSTAGDHAWMLEGSEGETMEELAELLMYASFLHMSIWYNNTLH